MRKLDQLILMGAALMFSTVTAGNVIYTWTADGVTESVAQQATARFDFSNANTLTLTLTDNVDPTKFILSELSGLLFTFTQAPTALTLTGVSAPSVIDCSYIAGSPCPPAAGWPSFYGWGATLSDGGMALGAGYSGGTFGYVPFDIVNQNYIAPGGNSGLSDPSNNPLLAGPVVFTFSIQGLSYIPEVSSATFLFGDPSPQNGNSIPEPGSLALIGLGLLSAMVATRRMQRS